ncbi:MAG TPA: pilin, partial [Burkholderiales bacterium]
LASSSVMGNTIGKYVSGIAMTIGMGISGPMWLRATMKATGVNTLIQSKTLYLKTLDGGKNWICSDATATILPRYRPAACR